VRSARRVRLADVTRRGRLRLDGVARYLQDVASDDNVEMASVTRAGWILRRLALEVSTLPALGATVELATTCSGVGARWAERTTTIAVDGTDAVVGRAVWVYVDLDSGAPRALPAELFAAYGDAIRARRVSARLTLPRIAPDAERHAWVWRSTDLDVYQHVNNANYWAPVEEWLAGPGAGRRLAGAEIEFGVGIGPGESSWIAMEEDAGPCFWFGVGNDVRATARLTLELSDARSAAGA